MDRIYKDADNRPVYVGLKFKLKPNSSLGLPFKQGEIYEVWSVEKYDHRIANSSQMLINDRYDPLHFEFLYEGVQEVLYG